VSYASPLDKELRPFSAGQIPEDLFAKLRQENLARWPSGAEVDLDEAVDYHLSLPDHKRLPWVLRQAEAEGRCLTQPRGGFGTFELQIELMKTLDSDGCADVVPTTTDSYTRNERWEQAEVGIAESEKAGRSMLNGFPMVNYGPKRTRQLIDAIDKPGIVLSGTCMPRLTGEVGYAAGYTGYLGSGLAYVTSYVKEMTIEEAIRNYQYLDRLAALYQDKGIELHRRQPGFLTGTNIPPSIAIVTCVIDALLAAAQGVKSYGLEMGQTLHLIQDAAAIRACRELMGAWPHDDAQCAALVVYGGTLAAIGGAASVTTKSTHEAFGIPTPQANAEGLRMTRMAIYLARQIRLDDHPEFLAEVDLIKREVRPILDRTFEIGEGDIAVGTVRACDAGIIDVPWSPNRHVKSRVMPARDADGYLRILDPGDMPFDKEVLELHTERLRRRAEREGVPCDRELAVSSVYEISEPLSRLVPGPSGGSK
jgi:methylaspartate mutase epsilon subunit